MRLMTERVQDLSSLTDLQTPWCIHVVASLGIAHHIDAGIEAIGPLADAAGCDARVLHAVIGHLVSKGVFCEPEPGRFELNDTARQLLDPPAQFLDLAGIGGRMACAWGTLPSYVRTGRSAYAEQFGMSFWDDLAAHPEVAASFDALMGIAGHGVPSAEIPLTGSWDGVRTVVDVGGGTGALLASILQARPGVHGTLVDLPGTVARADHVLIEAGVADRVTTVGQSFFDPLPAGADVYLLWKVLNDWPDEETIAILRRCGEAAAPDGVVLICGGVAESGTPPRLAIDMVVAGGRTNPLDEFESIVAEAGLRVVAAGQQPAGFVVECRPV
jgi:2,7-dihydroxy-5-methyl-1-naphthoate 7-O-methyltransferase